MARSGLGIAGGRPAGFNKPKGGSATVKSIDSRPGLNRWRAAAGALLAVGLGLIPCAIAPSAANASESAVSVTSSSITNYVAYTHGNATSANPQLSPVTIGWVNQQGGGLAFPNATLGAQAAVKYINTRLGGIDGHPLQLATCFIAQSESEGTTCGQQLVNNPAVKVILYGSLIFGDTSFQAVDQGTKPILIANSISTVDTNAKNVYVFNGSPSSIFGGMATYVAKVLRVKSVSVVYPQDAQSIAGAQALGSALKTLGIVAKSVGFDSSATNLTAPLIAAGAGSTGAIIPLVSLPPDCVAAAQAISALKVTSPVISAGSFCFSAPVTAGLGGQYPKWIQASTQSNVADPTQPDVKAYLAASAKVGLPASVRSDSNAALAWGLVMTTARFMNLGGGAKATSSSIETQARTFTGPMLLGGPVIKCGKYKSAPGLCGAEIRNFKSLGGGRFLAVSGWLEPTGIK